MIESLAYRLIAGQTATGGWGYTCKALTIKQYEQLKKALEAERLDRSTLPAWLKRLPIFQDPDKLMVKAPPDARKMKKKKMQPETPPPPLQAAPGIACRTISSGARSLLATSPLHLRRDER